MDIRKLGLGLGAFAAGAAAWVWGASRFGDRIGAALTPAPGDRTTPVHPAPEGLLDQPPLQAQRPVDARSDDPGAGVGAVPGDSTTSPVAPRPADMAAAPVGMAETEQGLPRPGGDDGHVPADLLADDPVRADARAPEAFRPDPTAIPTAAEREALRPATGPAPTLAADRGSGLSEAAGAA